MPLTPGQLLAHYRIESKIGQGGMGEVWAATDTRLHRSAAIKALPAAVAADPERLARFKREAQLLAALSHPNIAAIYGLEEIDSTPYLALELVEGEDLSARIQRGPLPVDEAIEIATQIAAALEAAHDKGIVHRDLKPANVKVAPDGKVKVLDFGLAKALSADPGISGSEANLTFSPTITATLGIGSTQAGTLIGTAAYMSPEQARGKPVDRRADLWAFGVILLEMLTGRQMFTGETVTDVIAQVVTREPDWDALPPATTPAVRRLLRRCLQKDPRRRLRDSGDAALELAEEGPDALDVAAGPGPSAAGQAANKRMSLVAATVLLLGVLGTLAVQKIVAPGAPPPQPVWSTLTPPPGSPYRLSDFLEISPDGRRVAFVAPAQDKKSGYPLWVRDLAAEEAHPLSGTEGAQQPFWSPDGRFIAYFAGRKLRRISVDGGVPTILADVGIGPRGGSWGRDGTILFVPSWSQPVFRVPAAGGTPEQVTQINAERLELSHRWPHLLPDGRHFLYFVVSTYPELNPDNPPEADKSGLYLGTLDGSEEPRLLQTARSRAIYDDGWLVFVDDNILMARPFDLGRLSLGGEPVPLAENVTQSVDALWGGALFSVSGEGTLLFARGAPENRTVTQMHWFDRQGKDLGTFGEPQPYNTIRISHDGTRVASAIGDPADVWIHDLQRKTSTRFTFDPGADILPLWSPDDERIVFHSSRLIPGKRFVRGNLFQRVSSGLQPEEYLATDEFPATVTMLPGDYSPKGNVVALTGLSTGTGSNILLFSFEDHSLTPYLAGESDEQAARFSPDGRWLAYESNETGRFEVYVQAFPGPGGKWQVSNGGGTLPVWRADGRELFYLSDDGLMAVPVETGDTFRQDTPVRLFDTGFGEPDPDRYRYDAAPDGKRFLFLTPVDPEGAEPASVTLLQNWRALLAD